ncbi:MAG: hypothetical protein P8Z77_03035 [Candidatus Thiodiazotropha sp.]
MMKFAVVIIIVLLALPSVVMALEPVDEIDLEVVSLLNLNEAQAVAYSAIMQQRRTAFRDLKPGRREQQMAFYEETYDMLKPVLTGVQYIRFLAYMDSFIEVAQDEVLREKD